MLIYTAMYRGGGYFIKFSIPGFCMRKKQMDPIGSKVL